MHDIGTYEYILVTMDKLELRISISAIISLQNATEKRYYVA